MSFTLTAIGLLAQAPRGKSFILAGHRTDNVFGRIQSVPFQLNLVLTNDNKDVLSGLAPGTALMVTGRGIGLDTGGMLLLAPLVVPLGAMPGTVIGGLHHAAEGVNLAQFAGNVTIEPVTEEFRGGVLRVTLSAEFNTRHNTLKIVSMGHSAAALKDLKRGDRLVTTGHVTSDVTVDPGGDRVTEVVLETSRIDTETSASYQARTAHPRKGKDQGKSGKNKPSTKTSDAPKTGSSTPKAQDARKKEAGPSPSRGVPKKNTPGKNATNPQAVHVQTADLQTPPASPQRTPNQESAAPGLPANPVQTPTDALTPPNAADAITVTQSGPTATVSLPQSTGSDPVAAPQASAAEVPRVDMQAQGK